MRGTFDGRSVSGTACSDEQKHSYKAEVNYEGASSPVFHVVHHADASLAQRLTNSSTVLGIETVNSRFAASTSSPIPNPREILHFRAFFRGMQGEVSLRILTHSALKLCSVSRCETSNETQTLVPLKICSTSKLCRVCQTLPHSQPTNPKPSGELLTLDDLTGMTRG